jgi:hypothetical protein
MKIGSEAHKELFCRTFLEGHRCYEPAELPGASDTRLHRIEDLFERGDVQLEHRGTSENRLHLPHTIVTPNI